MRDQSISSGKTFISLVFWLTDHWISLGMILVPVFCAASSLLSSDEAKKLLGYPDWVQLIFLIVGIALFILHIILSIFHLKHEASLSKLKEELDGLENGAGLLIENAQAVCDGFLQDLGDGPLEFGAKESNSERITLYAHDSEALFQPVGRFSFNPHFSKKGRSQFSESKGCIGKAWENGWYFQILPDPESDKQGWLDANSALGVPKTVCEKLRMKSALYCAASVRNGASSPLGVIVLESTDSTRYTEDDLKKVLTKDRLRYVARLLEMLQPYLGDIGNARKEGF